MKRMETYEEAVDAPGDHISNTRWMMKAARENQKELLFHRMQQGI